MKINLFEDFPAHSKEVWMAQVIKDLKGKDYEKTLTTVTEDGIKIEPIYTKEDRQGLEVLDYYHNRVNPASSIPGLPPRIWSNVSAFEGIDEKSTNAEILDALLNGVDALMLHLSGDEDLGVLLNEVNPNYIEIFLAPKGDPVKVFKLFTNWVNDQKWETNAIHGGLLWGGFGSALTKQMDKESISEIASDLMQLGEEFPGFKVFSIDAGIYHDSGASIVQELAYAFTCWIDLIEVMVDRGFYPQEIIQKSLLKLSVGADFFLEIAKVKAARVLMHKLTELYQIEIAAEDVFILAQTSFWTKSKMDLETNMVRNTTEAMAAILGGANSLYVLPHDIANGKSTSLATRMARNVSNILKEESYLDKILDPVAGTYYLENLIVEILQKVKTSMESIESKGGWWYCYESGYIQNQVKSSRARKLEEILQKKRTKIGVNKYLEQKGSDGVDGALSNEETWELLPWRESMSVENQKDQNS